MLQKGGGPTGQPRREKPSSARGISWSRELSGGESGSEEKKRHLERLSLKPLGGPSCSMMAKARERSAGEPIRTPSSRNQALSFKLGTFS